MGTIKVNSNDSEMTDLSHDQASEQAIDKDLSNLEFKVDADLLKIPEANPIKKIHNLS